MIIKISLIIILSGLLALGLTTNILAFPVILFKRTRSFSLSLFLCLYLFVHQNFLCLRFGNGQFAVLVLVLTMADLLTILVGLVGGLTLEVVVITIILKIGTVKVRTVKFRN